MACLFVGLAQAQFRTGNKLYESAKLSLLPGASLTEKEIYNVNYFYEYVAGTIDSDPHLLACIPSDIRLGRLADISAKYIVAESDMGGLPAAFLIRLALEREFPLCKTGKNKSK